MSPPRLGRSVLRQRFPRAPMPSCKGKCVFACGGFSQGRAPSLRAPEGSLDLTGSAASNTMRARGNESDFSEIDGTFLLCPKGTFSLCCHSSKRCGLPDLQCPAVDPSLLAEAISRSQLKPFSVVRPGLGPWWLPAAWPRAYGRPGTRSATNRYPKTGTGTGRRRGRGETGRHTIRTQTQNATDAGVTPRDGTPGLWPSIRFGT